MRVSFQFVAFLAALAACGEAAAPTSQPPANTSRLVNFATDGSPVRRLDESGAPLDAHDGEIQRFGGRYYLYGTSYGCGFEWTHAGTPFCGFRVYRSDDLVAWSDEGLLFDPVPWTDRCNGSTNGTNGKINGCFRPRVVFNASTGKYVLWFNSFDPGSGYHVFDSVSPTGPFQEAAVPQLTFNSNATPAINGDEYLFVDDDGTGYVIYTDWQVGGDLAIERLDRAYHSGDGSGIHLGLKPTESPALFKRGGRYFVTFSDPNTGYSVAATSFVFSDAPTPLSGWSSKSKLNADSCGGQPTAVSKFGELYLYQSDLWWQRDPNGFSYNQYNANYYWAPLAFDDTNHLSPLGCAPSVDVALPAP